MDLSGYISILIIAIISAMPFIYWYLTRNHKYWSNKGVKGPWPIPGLGTTIYFLIGVKYNLELNWFKKYGNIYGVYEGNTPVLRIGDPKLIKQILVKDFYIFIDRFQNPNRHPITDRNVVLLNGDDWKRVRSIISPTLTSGKMKKMYPLMSECLKDFVNALEMKLSESQEVDMKNLYSIYSMDLMATCAFGSKVDLYNQPDHLYLKTARSEFDPNYFMLLMNIILPKFLLKYFHITLFGDIKAKTYFYNIIKSIMKMRKNSDKCFNDFIESLMNFEKNDYSVRNDLDNNDSHHVNEGEEEIDMERKTFSGVEKYMTENEIISNAFIFLLAGYNTNAPTKSYCTHHLALNPHIQERLYSEIMSSVDSKGEFDYDLLARLPYLDAVVSETLRLNSIAFSISRIAAQDYKLGDTGITILKGQSVEVPIYAIHHCEEYYHNPEQFIPERFLPENKHKIIPYTYLPFGGGPRHCVGMRFTLLDIKLSLALVLKHYRIVRSTNTDIPVRLCKYNPFNVPERVIVQLVKRI